MAEGEYIIPIQIEADEPACENASEGEQNIAEPMEKLTIKKRKIQVKSAPKPASPEKNLKEFDMFEDRQGINLSCSNIIEKIVLVIDRAQDEEFTPFETNDSAFTPLSMLKRALYIFLKHKMCIDKKHEFALVVLNESNAEMIVNFTSDFRKLSNAIDKITECEVEDTFNLNTLFEEVLNFVEVPEIILPEIAPPYMVRVLILWGRSYTLPELYPDDAISKILSNPYFACDVLMTHEPVDKTNNCVKIFNLLQNIDTKGRSYFFPVGRDTRRLLNYMAKLLGHPLQRPIQKLI